MAWQQLKINTLAQYAETIGDVLAEFESQAVTFVDAKDTPMYEPKPGETNFWPNTQVLGLFDKTDDISFVLNAVKKALPEPNKFDYSLEIIEDKDWEREWMENFHPMQFGERLWICPSWHDIPEPDAVNIILDPGLAFGTGTHETTSLCLRFLEQADLEGKTVVDFGCGSGILAIAALKLGAKKVIGIDIDPQAIEASQANAQRNEVASRLHLYLPESQPEITADVVVANVLAAPLKELNQIISSLCRVGGQLVMSGVLQEQTDSVMNAYQPLFEFATPQHDGEWSLLCGTKITEHL